MKSLPNAVAAAAIALLSLQAHADNGLIVSANGMAQIGINETGNLDASTASGFVGIGYKFSGQGGRSGFQDALTPGCPCEAWGVSANGVGGQVGAETGNQSISLISSSASAGTYTSVTALSSVSGLTVTQKYTIANETATGALFKDTVTIHSDVAAKDVRYTRAMDWDVPPTEFAEYVTFKGTGTTSDLLRSTDNGFASANPITAVSDGGISDGAVDADGTFGPADHGALFTFGFGDLAAGGDVTFNIFYGAGADQTDALALLGALSPELYNLGQSSYEGKRRTDLPTFVFAFNGVGGAVVVPPPVVPPISSVPEPGTYALMAMGLLGLVAARRRGRPD